MSLSKTWCELLKLTIKCKNVLHRFVILEKCKGNLRYSIMYLQPVLVIVTYDWHRVLSLISYGDYDYYGESNVLAGFL